MFTPKASRRDFIAENPWVTEAQPGARTELGVKTVATAPSSCPASIGDDDGAVRHSPGSPGHHHVRSTFHVSYLDMGQGARFPRFACQKFVAGTC
jgi:hypothetical protein